jgi:ribonuclease HI
MRNKYYAYRLPSGESGIVDNWKDCEKKVSGKPNAKFKGFPVKKEAEEWLGAGADYSVKKDLEPGIYFDAGTGRGKGVEASVTDEKGKNLLSEDLTGKKLNEFGKLVLENGFTNNYGELLAMKFALELAKKKKVKKIFGDSKLAINYWSKGFVKIENINQETLELIDEVFSLREKFEKSGGAVIHISGRDNPADLGFHK